MDITKIPHINEVSACHGEYNPADCEPKSTIRFDERQKNSKKVLPSIEEAIKRSGLKDGMTISFHHHFRNGDYVVNMVIDEIARLGIKNLTLAASSLTDCHWPLIDHIKNGVITHIETSGLRGKLAEEISRGLMDFPIIFRSHGGRAAAIETGELHIDVAFLGAPSCDPYGNANGYNRDDENSSCCGSLGYAKLDAQHADKCIIITDHLVNFPNAPFGIPESRVDGVVVVDNIGDPKGIMSGATRYTKNPKELLIAKTAAEVIEASGYFEDNFSMQMGSGGASLATARFLRDKMIAKDIKCRFALGGITGQIVQMHEEGLVKKILDVQSFDLIAANSLKNNRFHQQIDASYYASYVNKGAAVNQLDFVILSALEIDVDFNVNVMTGSDGVIRGAVGGHPDTAAGASLTVVTAP
ncbi:MAG: citrate lyase subunit alpha, partial [Clostridia bacterium]|nr:citrate lyase subunit alpha [Clostridia bacterium]